MDLGEAILCLVAVDPDRLDVVEENNISRDVEFERVDFNDVGRHIDGEVDRKDALERRFLEIDVEMELIMGWGDTGRKQHSLLLGSGSFHDGGHGAEEEKEKDGEDRV